MRFMNGGPAPSPLCALSPTTGDEGGARSIVGAGRTRRNSEERAATPPAMWTGEWATTTAWLAASKTVSSPPSLADFQRRSDLMLHQHARRREKLLLQG